MAGPGKIATGGHEDQDGRLAVKRLFDVGTVGLEPERCASCDVRYGIIISGCASGGFDVVFAGGRLVRERTLEDTVLDEWYAVAFKG